MKKQPEIKGECFGLSFEDRDVKGDNILIQIWFEDDTNWHKTNLKASSFWIDDLIKVLKKAKKSDKYLSE